LLAAILEDVRARGLPRLVLETEKANEAARRFYERHGFASEDSVWMSLDLT
jgi:ribosomal protein S18 acetylase RimI-like enzyme